MELTSSFGVGCFHFWLVKEPPFVLDIKDYASELRKALEAVPSISNVSIDYDETYDPVHVTWKPDRLRDGETILPYPTFMDIAFDVYIPYRIQEELLGEASETETETFIVDLRYPYHAPVCFVTPLGAEKGKPSNAIRVVRDYLQQQINRSNGNIVFDVLGPSPFHADFHLVAKSVEGPPGFELNMRRTRGYDNLSFTYFQNQFADEIDAHQELLNQLEDELGFFYEVVLSRAKSGREWEKLQTTLHMLVRSTEKKKLRERIRSRFRRGYLINELFVDLVSFEASELSGRDTIQEGYRSIYGWNDKTLIQPYVDDCLKELPTHPTKQLAELVRFLESRRSKAIELMIILAAAIVGGVAGSLITVLFTRPH